MKTSFQKRSFAVRCRQKMATLVLCAVLAGVFLWSGPAWSIQLDQPPSVVGTDDTTLPIITAPSPVQAGEDSCLPLLQTARNFAPSPSAMDRDRHSAGKAAALGLVFGVRFALGPKEVARSRTMKDRVQLDVWQPEDHSGRQAMAVADYRRCKNNQALKAISDWRWKR